jgi:hypothetical protein
MKLSLLQCSEVGGKAERERSGGWRPRQAPCIPV